MKRFLFHLTLLALAATAGAQQAVKTDTAGNPTTDFNLSGSHIVGTLGINRLPIGTGAGTVAAGDDALSKSLLQSQTVLGPVVFGYDDGVVYAPVSIWNDPSTVVPGGAPGLKVVVSDTDDPTSTVTGNPIAGDFVAIYSVIDTGALGQPKKRQRIWGMNPVVERNHVATQTSIVELNINNNVGIPDLPQGENKSVGIQLVAGGQYPNSAMFVGQTAGPFELNSFAPNKWMYGFFLDDIGDNGAVSGNNLDVDSRFTGIDTSVLHTGPGVSTQYGLDLRLGQFRRAGAVIGNITPDCIGGGTQKMRPGLAVLQLPFATGGANGLSGGEGLVIQRYVGASTGSLIRVVTVDAPTRDLFKVGLFGEIFTAGGADADGSNDPGGITLGWRGGGYNHFIRHTHSGAVGSQGNGIDFFINNVVPNNGSTSPGVGNITALHLDASQPLTSPTGAINAKRLPPDTRVTTASFPKFSWEATGNPVNAKKFQSFVDSSGNLVFTTLSDDETVSYPAFTIGRNNSAYTGGAAAAGSTGGDFTAARSPTTGAQYIGSDGQTYLYRNGGALTVATPAAALTFPDGTGTLGVRVAPPTSSGSPGAVGQWSGDTSYMYYYTTIGWRRVAGSTF